MKNSQTGLALGGKIKVDVVDHKGNVVREGKWQKNLILNRGLDIIGEKLICDMFLYAAKGTGVAVTSQVFTNTYTLSGTNTLTRVTNPDTYNFTTADIGRVFRNQDGLECVITGYTSATVVTVSAVGGGAATNYVTKTGTLYRTDQDWLDVTEEGVTVIDPSVTTVSFNGTTTVTLDTDSTFNFSSGHVGKYLYFNTAAKRFKITARTNDNTVTVEDTDSHGAAIAADTAAIYTAITGSAASVSRATEYANGQCGTVTAAPLKTFTRVFLFPENTANETYTEIMLSDEPTPGNNINVRIKLASSVAVLGPAGADPGQRLKLTYALQLSVTPASLPGSFSATSITSTGQFAAASKAVIETFATSNVDTDGSTDSESISLEPSEAASMGLSTVTTTPIAFAPITRSAGDEHVEMILENYNAGSYLRDKTGTLELENGNGTAWRNLMIYDPGTETASFLVFYNASQTKDNNHTLTVTFRTSWGRDLS